MSEIGIPRERMQEENRVGLMPDQVAVLVRAGHAVRVEAGAGENAGFPDARYREAGARICSKEEAFGADLIVKVKCPLREEYPLLKAGKTLFAYLHFDGNLPAEEIRAIAATGITAIAYEWVEVDGQVPLLAPMSRISGVLFARRAMELLLAGQKHLGGAYGLDGDPARAMVIGAGHIGAYAIQTLARNDVRLVVVDKHPETLDERIRAAWPGWTPACAEEVIRFDEDRPEESVRAIRERLPRVDTLLGCAMRRAKLPVERMRYLVDRAAVATMRPGSILTDATANIRDLFETAVPTLGLRETYAECGVVHYNCEHIPSLAAKTSTQLLTRATFPYVRRLAEDAVRALADSLPLRLGTMCCRGRVTHPYTAAKKGFACASPGELLGF